MNYELRIKNKTVAAFLFLLIICGVFALPISSYAVCKEVNGKTVCDIDSPIKPTTIPDLICFVTKFLAKELLPPIAVVMMLWASFLYLTSAGQPGKIKQANEVVVWTIIGAGILLLSTALITLVMDTLQAGQRAKDVITTNPGLCSWESTQTTVVGTILNVVNLFSWFIGVLSVAMALYSGFLFMTSRGNPQNAAKAGKTIFYAIVGVTVAVISYSIIQIVENFIG